MLTNGVIKSVDIVRDRKTNTSKWICKVQIPLFDDPGDNFPDDLVDVGAVASPGIEASYKEGDHVVICFLENNFNKPVILGKYEVSESSLIDKVTNLLGIDKSKSTGEITCDSLAVINEAKLPASTQIFTSDQAYEDTEKDVTVSSENHFSTLQELMDTVSQLQNNLSGAMAAILTLQMKNADLEYRVKKLEEKQK